MAKIDVAVQAYSLYKYRIHLNMTPEDKQYHRGLGIWVWCQICKRCYLTGEVRLVDDILWCAYPDCNLGDIQDAIEWEVIRNHLNPLFPNIPDRDKPYLQWIKDYFTWNLLPGWI